MARLRPQQLYPSAGQLLGVYTVPSDKQVVLGSLHVCNQSADRGKFRVAIAPEGEDDSPEHYLYYDEPIDGYRAFNVAIGVTLREKDEVRVWSSHGAMSFQVFGAVEDA